MALGHVDELLLVPVGGEAVPGAAQGHVHHLGGLGPGHVVVRAEGAVPVAVGPAVGHGGADVPVPPVAGGHVVKGDGPAAGSSHAHAEDLQKLHPGDGGVGLEGAVPIAAHNVLLGQGVHRGVVPLAAFHVGKGGGGHRGLGGQQLVDHLGGLGPGHHVVRPEGAVAIAVHVGGVASGDQQGLGSVRLLLQLHRFLSRGRLLAGSRALRGSGALLRLGFLCVRFFRLRLLWLRRLLRLGSGLPLHALLLGGLLLRFRGGRGLGLRSLGLCGRRRAEGALLRLGGQRRRRQAKGQQGSCQLFRKASAGLARVGILHRTSTKGKHRFP